MNEFYSHKANTYSYSEVDNKTQTFESHDIWRWKYISWLETDTKLWRV